jgi:hypothetical protein
MIKDYYGIVYHAIIICLLSLIMSGCASVRLAPRQDLSKSDVYSIISKHNIEFDWWSCKGKVSLNTSTVGGSGKMYLRIKKDSLIWSVAKKASIEVARMNATPEEVVVKYPTEKTYQRGNVDQLSRQFGVSLSYEDVQQLLVGNVFLPDTTSSTLVRQSDGYLLSWSDPYGYDITYLVDDRTSQLSMLSIRDADGRSVKQSFDDYKPISNGNHDVAYSRRIEVDDDTQIGIRLTEVEVNEEEKTPFSINDRYSEISF